MNFGRLHNGVWHSLILLRHSASAEGRAVVLDMFGFSRDLPQQFNDPLPTMMEHLTPGEPIRHGVSPDDTRQLADAVAAWHFRSPLGICLRRSLLRYHFLRQLGVPVQITFGARFKEQTEGGGIGGHAWLLLNDEPYHEVPGDYEGFARLYTYPEQL